MRSRVFDWKDEAAGRQVEDQLMNGFITQQATSVSIPRVARVPVDAFRDASRPRAGARRTVGAALVAIGQRVAGEMPARRAVPVESDCS